MNIINHEQDKRHAFDSYCKKIVKHEARDHYDEVRRQREREVFFSALSLQEMAQLFTSDRYFSSDGIFKVFGLNVVVGDADLAEALRSIPDTKRDIILLSYFLGLTDREIGDKLGLIRATVQYQRKITLEQLRSLIEMGDDTNEQRRDEK